MEQLTLEKRENEHLINGVNPIMVCIGSYLGHCNSGDGFDEIGEISESGYDVDYYADREELKTNGSKNSGEKTYVISPIDNQSKFTTELFDCTSIIAVGVETETNVDISFLTHQDPNSFLSDKKDVFLKDLKESLEELKKRTIDGTVDIIILGGHVLLAGKNEDSYRDSIILLDSIIKEVFGFSPSISVGPKIDGSDSVFYNSKNRRVFQIRSSHNSHNEQVKPSDVSIKNEEWKKKQMDEYIKWKSE